MIMQGKVEQARFRQFAQQLLDCELEWCSTNLVKHVTTVCQHQ